MYNIRYGLNYLRHRFVANNRHGIHSPFVYKLIDTVIYDYSPQKVYREIENILKQPHPYKRVINSMPPKAYRLLYRFTVYFKPAIVAFAGDENGILSVPIKKAVPNASFLNLSTSAGNVSPDLVIIDASTHNIAQNLEKTLLHVHDDMVLMITNIHRTKQAKHVWNIVKVNKRIMLSIDLFHVGLIFFKENRKEKEHFLIKY